jgi:small subunit ribosomal protein S20
MPNTASAKKSVRQDEGRTLRNKFRRSTMRGSIRRVREAVAAGDKAAAQALLTEAYRQIDKSARSHILHANNAANQKSRLTRTVNAL